jgi:hypothetical protein
MSLVKVLDPVTGAWVDSSRASILLGSAPPAARPGNAARVAGLGLYTDHPGDRDGVYARPNDDDDDDDARCGRCNEYYDDCDCCGECDNIRDECDCCYRCEQQGRYCDCCGECDSTVSECDCCRECDSLREYCDCCSECDNTARNCTCEFCEDCNNLVDSCTCDQCPSCTRTVNSCDCDRCGECDQLESACACPSDCAHCGCPPSLRVSACPRPLSCVCHAGNDYEYDTGDREFLLRPATYVEPSVSVVPVVPAASTPPREPGTCFICRLPRGEDAGQCGGHEC